MKQIPVIDLFSGPGGLGEGFSSLRRGDRKPFRVGLSVEKDSAACRTLTLRAFYRQFSNLPEGYYDCLRGRITEEELYRHHPLEFEMASAEIYNEELGENEFTRSTLPRQIRRLTKNKDDWVLIGGPPCQAYSLVGRARNQGVSGYLPENDSRHFLYQEYLRVIYDNWPSVFVMENVKGLLSSKVAGRPMFNQILEDLSDPVAAIDGQESLIKDASKTYNIYPLSPESSIDLSGHYSDSPRDYIVKSEQHGIPQCRHRVILLGVRGDIKQKPEALTKKGAPTVSEIIGGLPKLRSGLSKDDSDKRWLDLMKSADKSPWFSELSDPIVRSVIRETLKKIGVPDNSRGGAFVAERPLPGALKRWFQDSRIKGVCNHETKKHMDSDVYRYFFLSALLESRERGKGEVVPANLKDFPFSLLPDHKNVSLDQNAKALKFADRFKVQRRGAPSSTVVSHIAKDGHYYIHYDPAQSRSLTVREAARLQTFPDNYFFSGNRTQQYTQVGNAVPPLLAKSVAEIVDKLLNSSA